MGSFIGLFGSKSADIVSDKSMYLMNGLNFQFTCSSRRDGTGHF